MEIQLDTLLTIEGVLGAVVVDRRGRVRAHAALSPDDAQLISSVASTFFLDAAGDPARREPRSYATFQLQRGQIHVGAGHALALILLTDPGLDPEPVRELLTTLVADLERAFVGQETGRQPTG